MNFYFSKIEWRISWIAGTDSVITCPGMTSFKGLNCHEFEAVFENYPINRPILSPAWVIEKVPITSVWVDNLI